MPNIYGIHAVKAFLKHQAKSAKALYVQEGLKSETKQTIKGMLASGTAIYTVSKKELEQKAASAMHQGVVLEVEQAHKKYQESDLASLCDPVKNPVVLVLDSVMDPHNIGACLRTANAAGIKTVIAPKDNAGDLTSTAIKVASGAAPYIEWVKVANLARSLRFLQQQGYWLVLQER